VRKGKVWYGVDFIFIFKVRSSLVVLCQVGYGMARLFLKINKNEMGMGKV